jgi:hypothetical protein
MATFPYRFDVPAPDPVEAQKKLEALARLASLLDARTLKALADKVPAILANPITSRILKNKLGL